MNIKQEKIVLLFCVIITSALMFGFICGMFNKYFPIKMEIMYVPFSLCSFISGFLCGILLYLTNRCYNVV